MASNNTVSEATAVAIEVTRHVSKDHVNSLVELFELALEITWNVGHWALLVRALTHPGLVHP